MLHELRKYEGHTLKDLAELTGMRPQGFSVFLLENSDDNAGKIVDEAHTVGKIVQRHPELADCIVKYTNGFFGQVVLRVEKPTEG